MEVNKDAPLQNNKEGEGILATVTNAINKTIENVNNLTPSEPVKNVAIVPNAIAAVGPNAVGPNAATALSINNVKETITNVLSSNENIFYLILLLVIITMITVYFLYYIITDNVLYQQKIEVVGTEEPIICNEMSYFKIDKMLANSNGIKRTYGFWIYINDISKYGGSFRHIAHIGTDHKKIKNASPYIFLDSKFNKIHVRFAPKDETTITEYDGLNDITEANIENLLTYDGGKRCGITINYIPIQRWVHVVIVVSDINGGLIYTYIDGELAEIEKAKDQTLLLHELNFENMGNLFVGGSIANSQVNTTGFSGLISKFVIYNYDLNKNDLYKEYNKGPMSGLLTSIGIPNYGLRNPIYKINNI
jgi:hypothetical protein